VLPLVLPRRLWPFHVRTRDAPAPQRSDRPVADWPRARITGQSTPAKQLLGAASLGSQVGLPAQPARSSRREVPRAGRVASGPRPTVPARALPGDQHGQLERVEQTQLRKLPGRGRRVSRTAWRARPLGYPTCANVPFKPADGLPTRTGGTSRHTNSSMTQPQSSTRYVRLLKSGATFRTQMTGT
jgi:hypothetical protein